MKTQLSINETYLMSWGIQEAIREVIQNAQDSDKDGYPMSVDYRNGKLIVSNKGVVLDKSVLILGKTSKSGREDQAGKFGEGLKLAMLVCARSGIPMTLRNGPEVWEPSIEAAPEFGGERVLTVNIRGGNKDLQRFQVEIEFPKEVWEDHKWKYLCVSPPKSKDTICTPHGRILKESQYAGCVFVRGIYVSRCNDFRFGYDLKFLDLDRDRRVVNLYDVRHQVKIVIDHDQSNAKLLKGPELYELISGGHEDLSVSSYESVPDSISDAVHQEFIRKHGEGSVPVTNMADSADLAHLGKNGVVVPRSMARILEKKYGSIEAMKASLSREVTLRASWSDMAEEERATLLSCMSTLNEGCPDLNVSLQEVSVVKFRDKSLLGLYEGGKILISRDVIARGRKDTMATLVHEVAHRRGDDGTVGHVREIERIWSNVYALLTGA